MVVDELLTGWLGSVLAGVDVSSVSPSDLEDVLPLVVVTGGGSDFDDIWQLTVDVDVMAAPDEGSGLNDGWHTVSLLAERVDNAFRYGTPAQFGGHSLVLLSTPQLFEKVGSPNTALRQMSAVYVCSTQ